MSVDMSKMEPLLGKMVSDLGPMLGGVLVYIGDRLGLYEAMAGAGPVTSAEIASRAGTSERLTEEWLCAQAASGYIEVSGDTFSLSPEQEALFVDEGSPFYMMGAFDFLPIAYQDRDKVLEAFRSNQGVGWGDHSEGCDCATAKFFKPTYSGHLLQEWIPALDGVQERMERGCAVADVGCGHGISTVLMGRAFPRSSFMGIDYHEGSIEHARENAREAGVANVSFKASTSKEYEGVFDIVALFDCFHDMGDPVGVASHVRESLKDGGTCFLVEPYANDVLADNLTPVGRLFYAASTMFCVPCAMSQNGSSTVLGAQAGEKRIAQCFKEAGFNGFERRTETPFNIVYQASL